ncbi:transglutaminase TgpA family protein [Ectobacillus ponti]|uniref:DUF3488 and transglutaminase-like domain-containing protein n=1 Tax=Ectobacillus ponti TaxID=2961894 RepID=A0AA41XA91_9BACI|nr:transglutaminase domain-containing protein [Ectobacillus ponti]MCP8969785.1 DUF3488 and transglutaminase-like domain-containing protein [Ectobacillus ponti]
MKKDLWLYAFGLLLLWEWLRPLPEIAGVTALWIFIVFMALCFGMYTLRVRWYLAGPVKVAAILLLTHTEYATAYDGTGRPWLISFIADLSKGMGVLLKGRWQESSVMAQTFFFFFLLWAVTWLFYWGMLRRRQVLPFLLLTIIYVAWLDTFTAYMGKGAILRLVIAGFLVMGLMQITRLLEGERQWNILWKMAVPFSLVVGTVAAGAYAAPKLQPQWPDPVPFLLKIKAEDKEESKDGPGTGKVGYSTDDSRLGGPFQGDDAVVFTTKGKKIQYWRMEVKSVYTGKGWRSEALEQYVGLPLQGEPPLLAYEPKTKVETAEASISRTKGGRRLPLMYPAGLSSLEQTDGVNYYLNYETEKITALVKGGGGLENYKVAYRSPTFLIEQLRAAKEGTGLETPELLSSLPNEIQQSLRQNPPEWMPAEVQQALRDGKQKVMLPPYLFYQYTQLPANLPQRVYDLAASVTKEKTNRYDKAVAIEEYLRGANFTYEKTDVATPGEDQDYVDQFLFDTKKGYCNNFSTSMVVMLRSLGIPSRWVKGYTEGDFVGMDAETGEQQYKVTNNNAHSWVEVYFPEYGWVPFEPTKGFANPADFVNETKAGETASSPAAAPASVQQAQQQRKSMAEKELMGEGTAAKSTKITGNGKLSWRLLLLLWTGAALLAYGLWRTRLAWLSWLLLLWYWGRSSTRTYPKAYQALLWQLARAGLKRQEGQTLREYAAEVDKQYGTTDMQELTQCYEQVLYSQGHVAWTGAATPWKRMMRRASRPKAG